MEDSIEAKRMHHQLIPNAVATEGRFNFNVLCCFVSTYMYVPKPMMWQANANVKAKFLLFCSFTMAEIVMEYINY